MRRLVSGLVAAGLVAAAMIGPGVAQAGAAQAVTTPEVPVVAPPATVSAAQDLVVNDDPAGFTPHVLDGEVRAVAEVGNTMVLGGEFTRARNAADGSPVLERINLLAFDKTTGQISTSFAPVVDDVVRTLVPAADGKSVYVGGKFGFIDGERAFKLARLDIATGEPVAGFDPGVIDSVVLDAKLNGNRLFIAGIFTSVGGEPREYLAELNPDTGAVRDRLDLDFGGIAWAGVTQAYKVDVSPDGSRLVVIGNFRTIEGRSRVQIAMLDLTADPVTVTDWATTKYDHECLRSVVTEFDARDVEFSPDGKYFVTVATGGATVEDALCDGAARWETNAQGPNQEPSWYALTGGDSVYAVAATGTAVYVGGHFRRWNSRVTGKSGAGPGAVERIGIAALDPVNGLPLTWNPTRDRGRAVWDLVATDEGLWVGNDTEQIGREFHARIAYFPLQGGTPVPQPDGLPLPVDVHLMSPPSNRDRLVERPDFNGTTAGAARVVSEAGTGWSDARGAFFANGTLYGGRADETFVRYPVTGDEYGVPEPLNLYGMGQFANEASKMSSLFYDNGRIYYTLKKNGNLYMRYFSVESEIVGSVRFVVAGDDEGFGLRVMGGAFFAGGDVYRVNKEKGTLARLQWADGEPVSGTTTVVSGPEIDGIDWRSRGLFARRS